MAPNESVVGDPTEVARRVRETLSGVPCDGDPWAGIRRATAALRSAPLTPLADAKLNRLRAINSGADEAMEYSYLDRNRARVTTEDLMNPPEPRRFVLEGRLPQDAGTLTGPGGGQKTTLSLWEDVHIILGRELYGRQILKSGACLMLSGEDERRKLLWRLAQITKAMQLSRDEVRRVAENLLIPDLSSLRLRLVDVDDRGNLRTTKALDRIIAEYEDANIARVTFDPLIYFGPGERFVNDGGAEVMFAGRRLAHQLGCCVQFISHTSMATARHKQDDQYSARGAAAVSDNGRYCRNLWVYARDDREKFGDVPSAATPDDIVNGNLLALTQPKLSDGPRVTETTWLIRRGWAFEQVFAQRRTQEERDYDDVKRVCAFLTHEESLDEWHTARSVEEAYERIGMRRNRLRKLVSTGLERGWLAEREVPPDHPFRQGQRKHRLAVGILP